MHAFSISPLLLTRRKNCCQAATEASMKEQWLGSSPNSLQSFDLVKSATDYNIVVEGEQ
jgi:hypothetical protein